MQPAELSQAIGALEIPLDRDALALAVAARDLLHAKVAVAVAEFEAAGLHESDGDVTMPAWLRHHAGVDTTDAARTVRLGRKLRALPVLLDAVDAGALTGGQVEAVCVNVPLRHVELFATHEAEVIPTLVGLSVEDTRTVMARWKSIADDLHGVAPAEVENRLHLSTTLDGRGELRGSLDADHTAIAEAALRVADPKDFSLTMGERRAEAFDTVCRFYLDHQQARPGGRHRPHVNVVVDELGTGTYLDTSQPVSTAELGVLLCDCTLHRLRTQGSAILDYGRATRTWPVDLYNAIAARDQGCRWPGCDRPPSHTDVHHVHECEHGGDTSIGNGAMLCRRHHRLLHRKLGWHAKLLPDATFEVTAPDGTIETSRARGPTRRPVRRRQPIAA